MFRSRVTRSKLLVAAATACTASLALFPAAAQAQAQAPAPAPAPAPSASSPSASSGGSIYVYHGKKPLADIAPGTVLQTQTVTDHISSIPLPLSAIQIQYRSINGQGKPDIDVTSVIKSPYSALTGSPDAVAYDSAYDSLNPADEPSEQIAGNTTTGGQLFQEEEVLYSTLLLEGDTVIVDDTEGQTADFADGPEYGYDTLNSIKAATHDSATGLSTSTKIALMGYSGGAIATDWAAQLAPSYAPSVEKQLVGAAEGGVLVDPAHNLLYVSGSKDWAGVIPMTLIGLARGFGVNLTSYMSPYGIKLNRQLQKAYIGQTTGGQYAGLTWAKLVKPAYRNPDSIGVYVKIANQLDLGLRPNPKIPMFIGQGANGTSDGTPNNKPGIGAGDGVMITGDVRSLARKFCASGDPVEYQQYNNLSHEEGIVPWAPEAEAWIASRFLGVTTNNCSSIAPGNSLAPQKKA